MTKPVAFSYSRLDSFETCPKKFYAISVQKSVKDEGNQFTKYGEEVHLAFADYFKKAKSLPMHMSQYQKFLSKIRAAPGQFIVEQQLAIDANYEGCEWYSKDAYCRVISDLTIINDTHAVLWDWKTGKMKDGFDQLRLAGAVVFLLAPDVQTMTMAYLWTQSKKITKDTMVREDMPKVFEALQPRLQRYQDAHANLDFPARPGFACKYCPVKTCPYNEAKK